MALKEAIAQLLGEQFGYSTIIDRQAYKVADAIMAIPEIRDALAIIDNRDETIRDMALEIAELRIKYEPQS